MIQKKTSNFSISPSQLKEQKMEEVCVKMLLVAQNKVIFLCFLGVKLKQ